MTHTTGDAGASGSADGSASELIHQLTEQVSTLVRDELKLAQLEMRVKGKRVGLGIGMLGGGGVIALYAAGCLVACAIIAISGVLAAWLAALIVGAGLLVAAAIAALVGKGRLQAGTPPVPTEAVDSIKADVQAVRARAHR